MEDELAALEKQYDQDNKQKNPLGNSITKEMLQQSKKEILDDVKKAPGQKKLEIEIDDNASYNEENQQVINNLNDKLAN